MSNSKPTQFIDIKQTKDCDRTSCFQVTESGLQVIGNLPHGYFFEPKDIGSALDLIAWLSDWVQEREGSGDGE